MTQLLYIRNKSLALTMLLNTKPNRPVNLPGKHSQSLPGVSWPESPRLAAPLRPLRMLFKFQHQINVRKCPWERTCQFDLLYTLVSLR